MSATICRLPLCMACYVSGSRSFFRGIQNTMVSKSVERCAWCGALTTLILVVPVKPAGMIERAGAWLRRVFGRRSL